MDRLIFVFIGLVGVFVAFVVIYNRRPVAKYGEILPADEMKAKYNITSKNYKPPKLDPEKVPEQLHDLLPLAAKWGIGDDIIRSDFEENAPASEKEELKKTLTGRMAEITEWLDSFNDDHTMSDEAACFMYMQLGVTEMGMWPD